MDLKEIYFDTGELRLHALEGPASGPPLVLLHGATANCTEWNDLLPRLTQHWHVYSLDLRGHGRSGRPETLAGYHIRHHIEDTAAFLRGQVRQPAVLLGHSYGAVTALLTARHAPEQLRALVLEDPPLMLRRENNESRPYLDYFTAMYRLRQKAATLEEITAALTALNPAAPAAALRPWAQTLAWLDPNYLLAITTGNQRETVREVDFEAHIRAIACPVLMLQADPAKGAALAAPDLDFFLAHAPHTRLATFPGASHGIHKDQPAAFLQAFESFCAGLP